MLPVDPGENPVVDLLFHGRHPFPRAVEVRLLHIHRLDPRLWRELAVEGECWQRIRGGEDSYGRVILFLDRILGHLDPGGRPEH